MSFGENLISLRKQMGWSQDDLANNLNLSRQAISKWENDTSKPDIDNVKKISKIFSVTIDDLLNNEVPKEKAVALDVKKEEKKERTITIVKLMIIAVIVLYVISVIYKFASLLIIVNGVQKYANLSNYHYVITTYENNELTQKEECWFKEGVSKTINTIWNENNITEEIDTGIDYKNRVGYTKNITNNTSEQINIDEYLNFHNGYENGKQLYSNFPIDIRNEKLLYILSQALDLMNFRINIDDSYIFINMESTIIVLNKEDMMPISILKINSDNNNIINEYYKVNLNDVDSVNIY